LEDQGSSNYVRDLLKNNRAEPMHPFWELRRKAPRDILIGAALLITVGALAALYYDLGFYTPSIAQHGQVTVASGRDATKRVTAPTRLIVMRQRFWQVEYPEGVWNDCRPSCAETLRKAAFNE
jgi:hypothetical protein